MDRSVTKREALTTGNNCKKFAPLSAESFTLPNINLSCVSQQDNLRPGRIGQRRMIHDDHAAAATAAAATIQKNDDHQRHDNHFYAQTISSGIAAGPSSSATMHSSRWCRTSGDAANAIIHSTNRPLSSPARTILFPPPNAASEPSFGVVPATATHLHRLDINNLLDPTSATRNPNNFMEVPSTSENHSSWTVLDDKIAGTLNAFSSSRRPGTASTVVSALEQAPSWAMAGTAAHYDQQAPQQPPKPQLLLQQLAELRARARCHVESAIRCFPAHQTAAYWQAKKCTRNRLFPEDPDLGQQTGPPPQASKSELDLVMTETDPLQFVRYCNYDVLEGAKRLCLYWTERRYWFGPERAFLPLTLTGTGALTPEDLLSLRAGFPAMLPETTTGRSCLLMDRRKRIASCQKEHVVRCFFYVYKILAQNDWTQIGGAWCLDVSATPRFNKGGFDADLVRGIASLTARIFPVKLQFLLLSIPNQLNPDSAADLVQELTIVLEQAMVPQVPLKIHSLVESEPQKILKDLLALGLTKPGVPYFVGGEWKFEDFSDWCEQQITLEQEQNKNQSREDTSPDAGSHRSSKKKATTPVVAWSKFNRCNVAIPTASSQGNTASGQTRSVNSTRHAGRLELGGGTGVATDAVGDNNAGFISSLAQQQEGLSQQRRSQTTGHKQTKPPAHQHSSVYAVGQVQDHDAQQRLGAVTAEERVAKRKVADMLYSRRKREREQVKIQQLKDQSAYLVQENELLVVEQDRLQKLLLEAEDCVADLSATSTSA
ncbi:hypothetical protein ACA910_002355 [Epithemia clementina (nom. ined.)]